MQTVETLIRWHRMLHLVRVCTVWPCPTKEDARLIKVNERIHLKRFSFCRVLLCFHARLFVDALWSPAEKGLTSRFSFVMSNCDVVTFTLVSWVRCGA